MKYCLLWATCFIGLLQLSAVTCRSAHDKVIEKEAITLLSSDNEKYSTTVGPSVAYTGQEIERDENSTDKLALEPGPMWGDGYYYRREPFNYPLLFLCLYAAFAFLSIFGGCIFMFWRAKKIRRGLILNDNWKLNQFSGQEPDSKTLQLTPFVYQSVQYASQPQPVMYYRPSQQPQPVPRNQLLPLQNQGQAVASTSQASIHASPMKTVTESSPSVVEFSNPVCSMEDLDKN